MCVSEDDTMQMCVVAHGCTQIFLQSQKAALFTSPNVDEKGIQALQYVS